MIETVISQDQVPALPENPVSNFQFSRKDIVLGDGNNDDIATDLYNYLRVTGPSAAFAIRGFAGGIRGAVLYVEIDIAQTLTLANLSSGSLPGNRILTGTGADISITTPCVLQFIFNDDLGAWVLVGKQIGLDGWLPSGSTWTYASANTFTINGDVTAQFQKGTKLKLTQTSVKYFYVVNATYSAPNTTITVTGGSDYSLANAAIVSPNYSYVETPQGFPDWFNWSPTLTGFSANPSNSIYRFRLNGHQCTVMVRSAHSAGTSNSTAYTITAPINAATITNMQWNQVIGYPVDNSAALSTPGLCTIASGAGALNLYKNTAGAGWTASGLKAADFVVVYEI